VSEVRVDEPLRGEAEEGAGDEGDARLRLGIGGLASDTAFYGGTRALLKSLAFLLVPLYAHFLTPADFGVLELVLATIALVDVVISANMDGVFGRFYFDREEREWRRKIITLYLVIEGVYPMVVVGTLIALSDTLSERVFGAETYAAFFVIALVDVYLTNVVDLPMAPTRSVGGSPRSSSASCSSPSGISA